MRSSLIIFFALISSQAFGGANCEFSDRLQRLEALEQQDDGPSRRRLSEAERKYHLHLRELSKYSVEYSRALVLAIRNYGYSETDITEAESTYDVRLKDFGLMDQPSISSKYPQTKTFRLRTDILCRADIKLAWGGPNPPIIQFLPRPYGVNMELDCIDSQMKRVISAKNLMIPFPAR